MKFMKALSLFSMAVMGLGLLAGRASATNFATFQETNGSGFVWTTDGTAGGTTITSTSIPVNFEFAVPNLYAPVSTSISANLIIQAITVPGPATNNGIIDQPISELNYEFVSVTGSNVLLTVQSSGTGVASFSEPDLLDLENAGNLNLAASSTAANTSVVYSSSYLNFTNPPSNQQNYAWSFSDVEDTNPADGQGPELGANNYLASFTANVTGTLSATPNPEVTPEPNPIITVGIAVVGLFGLLMFGKKRASRATLAS